MAERLGMEMMTNGSFPNSGIPNSLAIEFDTYQNGWDPSASHVAIQSCGTGYNTSHHGNTCPVAEETRPSTYIISLVSFADGNIHTVTIQYNPPSTTPCDTATPNAQLCVYLDRTPTSTPIVVGRSRSFDEQFLTRTG